jgi:cation diffusion facilitator CzcD-associated flavoprotein CzcO
MRPQAARPDYDRRELQPYECPAVTASSTDVAIIGAGPYGLSLAAHLRSLGTRFRIFGTPMHSWRFRMPTGMLLKSDGFASDLYAPGDSYRLSHYSAEQGLPYRDVGYAVPLATFVAYGLEFQRRHVPGLEVTNVTALVQSDDGFRLETATGDSLRAHRVVLAVGITHFGYVPPLLAALPAEYVTHSSAHTDPGALRGRRVAVIGAGASAIDLAVLMHEAGVDVELLARRHTIAFHPPPSEPRPWTQRLLHPRSGLGLGWRSLACADAPQVFYSLPLRLRLRAVQRHLGPAPGWPMRERLVGRLPVHLGTVLRGASVEASRVRLAYQAAGEGDGSLEVDHVVAATGYKVSLERLPFIEPKLRERIRHVQGAPLLRRNFESSVPGLFVCGLASAASFGPLARFAYGAGFATRVLTRALARGG